MARDPWAVPPPSTRVLRLALVMSLVLPVVLATAAIVSLVHRRWVSLAFAVAVLALAVWVRSLQWPVWRRQLREALERDGR